MGKPYQTELEALATTYTWAHSLPTPSLTTAIQQAAEAPLLCVGSGGSLSAAHYAALLHVQYTGQFAQAMTPLEVVLGNHNLRDVGVLLVSAGGSNRDIIGALKQVFVREPKSLIVVCARSASTLTRLAAEFGSVHVFGFDTPTGKDGFLATNSLLASSVLLRRAYEAGGKREDTLPCSLDELLPRSWQVATNVDGPGHAACRSLLDRETLTVLYGPALKPVAVDLESRFTEAALGHAHIADFRNFGHGRHYWIARHGSCTGVLSLETAGDEPLAERTLGILPAGVPSVRFVADGNESQACLAGLVFGLHLAGLAGQVRGVDPGAPRVPSFGREVYHLSLPARVSANQASAAADEQLAIERKTGGRLTELAARGQLKFWRDAYQSFTRKLQSADFDTLILDYDGTLCDECEKETGLRPEVAQQLDRVLAAGIRVGIATGRGESAREALRRVVPRSCWGLVTVGYRNGAEVADLADPKCPSQTDEVGAELEGIGRRIADDAFLAGMIARMRFRSRQISVHPRTGISLAALWQRLFEIASGNEYSGINVLLSSHSVDLVAPGVSKRAVLDKLCAAGAKRRQGRQVLCIGDRGRWPGNDYELLQVPHSLSVDEVSLDPSSCWRLSSAGVRDVQATLEYLRALRPQDGKFKLRF